MKTLKEKLKNDYYAIGYKIGYENKRIAEFDKTIDDNGNGYYSDDEFITKITVLVMMHYSYDFVEEKEMTKKEAMYVALGYSDGKANKIRDDATGKYQEKIGLMSKSYKLNKEVVADFADTCKINKHTQARVLTKLMQKYIAGEINVD